MAPVWEVGYAGSVAISGAGCLMYGVGSVADDPVRGRPPMLGGQESRGGRNQAPAPEHGVVWNVPDR